MPRIARFAIGLWCYAKRSAGTMPDRGSGAAPDFPTAAVHDLSRKMLPTAEGRLVQMSMVTLVRLLISFASSGAATNNSISP